MTQALLMLVGLFLLLASANRVAERLGVMRCECDQGCWCRRPGLSLFRWVFPWGHRPGQPV